MRKYQREFARRVGLVIGGVALAWSAQVVANCQVHSGPRTAALVELYTSEGCSSCPPADRQLSRLTQAVDRNAEVVPLSLHVDYWDAIGWKDPFGQSRFGERQSWLVRASGHDTVYTPQFFVGGSELRSWQAALPDKVRQVNATPAAADIRMEAVRTSHDSLTVNVAAHTARASAALYLAVTESGLVSKVSRGENSGATLAHDHVVRQFFGPVRLADGEAVLMRDIPLPSNWNRDRVDLAAFVASERTGEVLQALAANDCTNH